MRAEAGRSVHYDFSNRTKSGVGIEVKRKRLLFGVEADVAFILFLQRKRKMEEEGRKKEEREKGEDKQARPGDWICGSCGDLQFARNRACRKLVLLLGQTSTCLEAAASAPILMRL